MFVFSVHEYLHVCMYVLNGFVCMLGWLCFIAYLLNIKLNSYNSYYYIYVDLFVVGFVHKLK